MSSPTEAISKIGNEVKVDTKTGIKIRIYRNEPFRFFSEINKWLESLNIGEVCALQMNTDANGWVNYTIAYREPKPDVQTLDPVVVLYDTAAVLKDVTDVVERLASSVNTIAKLLTEESPPGS